MAASSERSPLHMHATMQDVLLLARVLCCTLYRVCNVACMACRYTVDTTVLVNEWKLKNVDRQPLSLPTFQQVSPHAHHIAASTE